jgi:hypothetical protein
MPAHDLADDGLYAVAKVTDRGNKVLSENPAVGISARIVESFERSDGQFWPARSSTPWRHSIRGSPT